MHKKINLVISAALLLSPTILIAKAPLTSFYYCSSKGFNLRHNKDQKFLVDASLYFNEVIDSKNIRTLKNIVGHMQFTHEEKLGQNSYYGIFNNSNHKEDRSYKPEVYLDYSQFRNFNAQTTNHIDGGDIWGYFVLEKNNHSTRKAHYIFKAGYHMGGTIDFTCTPS